MEPVPLLMVEDDPNVARTLAQRLAAVALP